MAVLSARDIQDETAGIEKQRIVEKGEVGMCGIAGFYSSRHSYTQEGERWEKVLEGMNCAQKRRGNMSDIHEHDDGPAADREPPCEAFLLRLEHHEKNRDAKEREFNELHGLLRS